MNIRKMKWPVQAALAVVAGLILAGPALCRPVSGSRQEGLVLDNGRLKAEFGEAGLTSLTDLESGRSIRFGRDLFSLKMNGQDFAPAGLGLAEIEIRPASLVYSYNLDPYTLEITYELRSGWRFLTKQLSVSSASFSPFRIESVSVMEASMGRPAVEEVLLGQGSFGLLRRFASQTGDVRPGAWSFFAMLQNPFQVWKRDGPAISVSYSLDMDWKSDFGPFLSDRLCLGFAEARGTKFPVQAVPEWRLIRDYEAYLRLGPVIYGEEIEALTECVRAFLLYLPQRSLRVHVPWCENDYQIDVGTAEGQEEYKRIIDRAAELGCGYVLFTPANSLLSALADNSDAWGWENVLWFGLGQKMRKEEWDPRVDDLPAGLKDMIDYAAGRNVKLLAYAYPSLAFKQRPEWTAWTAGKAGGSRGADTGLRSFQDWWVETCLAFMKKTGAAGFSFDHWWINYEGASSKYAQWFGLRRILENLRKEAFDIVIDGRQQYQNFGPWTWLAGSYPHPVLTDEQPESFKAFPDLHTDRVAANRQRFAAWVYRVERFCPPEILPGFITHQSERSDEKGVMRRDRFRPRDWDYGGWKYSLLSSIATAPFNHVVNFIPARDAEEFKALSENDRAWFRKWLDWTDENARYLRHVRPIIGPPAAGRIDGTAAIVEDSGYVFLFNPNPEAGQAVFTLDGSIGLTAGSNYVVRELFPEEGRLIASPEGFWPSGSELALDVPGRQAVVLEIFRAPDRIEQPVLFNALGDIALRGRRVSLTSVKGEPGTTRELAVMLPAGKRADDLTVNGVGYPFRLENKILKIRVRFAGGRAFGRSQPIGKVPAGFTGGIFRADIVIPARIFKQLEGLKRKWPVKYTPDDLKAPWLGPWRLLLYVALAEPDDRMEPILEIDGKRIELAKAYNSVYPHSPERTFLGFYADVSSLQPDIRHEFKLTLPPMEPGQFGGLFFENVETEYTILILAPPGRKG